MDINTSKQTHAQGGTEMPAMWYAREFSLAFGQCSGEKDAEDALTTIK